MEGKEENLLAVIEALKSSFSQIAAFLRDSGSESSQVGISNAFGEKQLEADVFSDQTIFTSLQGLVKQAVSEETTTPQQMGGSNFIVTFDPLDGSSIIDTNFSVGSIFGIWDVDNLIGATGRDLVISGIVVYGSRTTMLIETKTDILNKEINTSQVDEFTLIKGEWLKTKENLKIRSDTKMFSPANLRAVNESEGYRQLVESWQQRGFTLRYTGGMVPDVYQIFIKGSGVFSNPTTSKSPPKLRLLYESAPIARLVEIGDGMAYAGPGSVLDLVVTGYEQKTQMCVGSRNEVERYRELVG